MRRILRACLVVLFAGTSGGRDAALAQVGTAFTYQGRLLDGAAPANGSYDLELTLWDAATGGFLVGGTALTSVAVASGLFTVAVDFGPGMFTGSPRWLEIGVRRGGSSGAFTTLVPRQELMPVANAIFASYASDAATVSGLFCGDGQVAKWSGTAWNCGTDVDTNGGGTVTSVETGAVSAAGWGPRPWCGRRSSRGRSARPAPSAPPRCGPTGGGRARRAGSGRNCPAPPPRAAR